MLLMLKNGDARPEADPGRPYWNSPLGVGLLGFLECYGKALRVVHFDNDIELYASNEA